MGFKDDNGHAEILPQTEQGDSNEPPQRRRSGRNRLICVLVVLVILLALIIVLCLTIQARVVLIVYPEQIIVPDTDKREYRVIELTNSIMVTLVSDRNSPTASSSFNVQVGSLSNPDDVLGLAHYLEHMLFMGTEKYPTENKADSTASDFDGWINAYTDDLNTNYHFSVENSGLKNMSDIYTQFFIKPLLKKDALTREMMAVNSEYMMGFSSNFWPFYELMTSLSNPKSPHSRFSTGSLTTLNKTNIQERLREFYDRYYSANLMTIAMVGNETLDTLQDWAEELYTPISNKKRDRPTFNVLPFPYKDKRYICRRIYYIPKSDDDTLKIVFPINIPGRPNLSFGMYILGYEGKGSLFQYLSKRGYITQLMASINVETNNFIALSIAMDLTELGLKQPQFIIESVFKYIRRMKENGINRQLWEENKKIDVFKFKFRENDEAHQLASVLAANMAIREDPKDYLNPPSRRLFNETLENDIVAHLIPENFNYYIGSQKLSTESKNIYGPQLIENEPWYDTPFANLEIPQADIDSWKAVNVDEELTLPERNVFIPENFELLDSSTATKLPIKLSTNSTMELWWYLDTEFGQPKNTFGCRIHPTPRDPTVQNNLLAALLSSMYTIETAEALYPALTVEFAMQMLFNDYWVAHLNGFSDPEKVKEVINRAMDSIFRLDFGQDEAHFDASVVEPLRKSYQNIANLMPAQLARRYAKMLQDEFMYDFPEAIEQLASLSQSDVKQYRDDFLRNVSINCFAMGNVLSSQADKYAQILQTKLSTLGKAYLATDNRIKDFIYPTLKLEKGKTYIIRQKVLNKDDPNSGSLAQFQIGVATSNGPYTNRKPYTRYVLNMLLGLMLKERCFNYLRTQQQLGYVASCFHENYKGILGYAILVQGARLDAGAEVMASKIDTFLDTTYKVFTDMEKTTDGKEFFEGMKQALRKQLEDKPISMTDKYNRFANEIFDPSPDFERKSKQTLALDDITFSDFLEYYERYLLSNERRKISVRVFGKGHTIPTDINSEIGEIAVSDIVQFRKIYLKDTF